MRHWNFSVLFYFSPKLTMKKTRSKIHVFVSKSIQSESSPSFDIEILYWVCLSPFDLSVQVTKSFPLINLKDSQDSIAPQSLEVSVRRVISGIKNVYCCPDNKLSLIYYKLCPQFMRGT